MSGKESSIACMHFDDVECNLNTFQGLECWCHKAEIRKEKDKPEPMTTMEAIYLGFSGSK
jgi:hypothetical protein